MAVMNRTVLSFRSFFTGVQEEGVSEELIRFVECVYTAGKFHVDEECIIGLVEGVYLHLLPLIQIGIVEYLPHDLYTEESLILNLFRHDVRHNLLEKNSGEGNVGLLRDFLLRNDRTGGGRTCFDGR